jgi:hypothetical protein
VNYPPVIYRHRSLDGPVARHAYSDLGYRYFAVRLTYFIRRKSPDDSIQVVTFTDGRTEHVRAGHTAFVPAAEVNVQAPFTWNTTFKDSSCRSAESPMSKKRAEDMEKCLPEAQRSTFAAEITLEEGNVVRKGTVFLTCHIPSTDRTLLRRVAEGAGDRARPH